MSTSPPTSTTTADTFRIYTAFRYRAEWRTTLFWAIGLSIYTGVLVSVYPSIRGALNLNALPANMRAAFNITDFTQLASFLSAQVFGVILPILLPFFAMIALSGVIAGAEERGRLDILLGNPLPRWQVVIGSFLVIATYLLAIVAAISVALWAMAQALDLSLSMRQAWRAAFALWPLATAFGALSLALSALVRQRSWALGIPAAVLFLMYLLNVIGRLAPAISWVRWLSAFNYYGVAITEGLWWPGVATLVGSAVVLTALATLLFNRRDIYA
ncbi:MAG: ABC transporter permease subunit [Thermomicrobiales bacterium]